MTVYITVCKCIYSENIRSEEGFVCLKFSIVSTSPILPTSLPSPFFPPSVPHRQTMPHIPDVSYRDSTSPPMTSHVPLHHSMPPPPLQRQTPPSSNYTPLMTTFVAEDNVYDDLCVATEHMMDIDLSQRASIVQPPSDMLTLNEQEWYWKDTSQ